MVLSWAPGATSSARSTSAMAPSRGSATPTRILPLRHLRVVERRRPPASPAVTISVMTVARIAPSIVSSKMTIRFGHHATIGMLPVGIGQASLGHARSATWRTAGRPVPPAQAMYHRSAVARSDVAELVLLHRLRR